MAATPDFQGVTLSLSGRWKQRARGTFAAQPNHKSDKSQASTVLRLDVLAPARPASTLFAPARHRLLLQLLIKCSVKKAPDAQSLGGKEWSPS